jgi:PPM family protein phosphatase
MLEAKNTQRALVRISYDGKVLKQFRGPEAVDRFNNEVRVLRYLEQRDCPFVPRLLAVDESQLLVTLTNCGQRVESISEEKLRSLFHELESFGVRHDDPFDRNVTYRSTDGRFCVIDFEFAKIIDPDYEESTTTSSNAVVDDLPNKLQWSARSHRGRFRPNNEDTYLAIELLRSGVKFLGVEGSDDLHEKEWLFAVSDGMGGEKSGEFASRIAVQRITTILPQYVGGSYGNTPSFLQATLINLFQQVHADLLRLAKYDKDLSNMGATLTLVWIRGDKVIWSHVGDSRLYLLRDAEPIQQITEDHSHVGWLRRTNKISEYEFRSHPGRSVLSQCLGSGHQFLKPQTGCFQLQKNDRLLLCTDGVIDGHFDRGLTEMLIDPPQNLHHQSAADRCVFSAVKSSGRDNASAVVVEVS